MGFPIIFGLTPILKFQGGMSMYGPPKSTSQLGIAGKNISLKVVHFGGYLAWCNFGVQPQSLTTNDLISIKN